MPRTPLIAAIVALALAAASGAGCASFTRDGAKAGTEGTIEALRESDDEVVRGLRGDLARNATLTAIARRIAEGVLEAVEGRTPAPRSLADTAVEVANAVLPRIDLLGPTRTLLRELAKDAKAELRAELAAARADLRIAIAETGADLRSALAPALESARSVSITALAADVAAAVARSAAEQVAAVLSRELSTGFDRALEPLGPTATAAVIDRLEAAVERIAVRATRGTLAEVRAEVERQATGGPATWIALGVGAIAGIAVGVIGAVVLRRRRRG